MENIPPSTALDVAFRPTQLLRKLENQIKHTCQLLDIIGFHNPSSCVMLNDVVGNCAV
jgi:hypothetical protein